MRTARADDLSWGMCSACLWLGCLVPVWGSLGWSSPFLGQSWVCVGPALGCLRSILCYPPPVLGRLGPVLALSWVVLDLSWNCLGLSWTVLGLSWPSRAFWYLGQPGQVSFEHLENFRYLGFILGPKINPKTIDFRFPDC